MMVIFTSLSEKKAIRTTRWILDAFADRIGKDVWQTSSCDQEYVSQLPLAALAQPQ